ncbi:JAB domain-containing protein [Megasphaera stantonii]|uniref:JAB domain-containing protein n=1 Tax=Megasphaera stantonii TaxID=2144175 RepID=UPI003208843E
MKHNNYVPDEELLAAFIPKESAQKLVQEYASLYHIFTRVSDEQLQQIAGIGKARLRKISMVKEVMERMEEERRQQLTEVSDDIAACAYFKFLEDKPKEELWALLLNTKNQVLACQQISVGTVNTSWAGIREVYHAAIQHLSFGIILAHNHPSGDSTPSLEDINVTRKMIQAGEMLEIRFLDHVIIGRNGNYSFYAKQPELWD